MTSALLRNAQEGIVIAPDDADLEAYRALGELVSVTALAPCAPPAPPLEYCGGCAGCAGWVRVELTDAGRAQV